MPTWNFQGGAIAYFHFNSTRDDSVYPTGLYTIDTNGQNRRLVIEGFTYNPDWSPDGSHIVFNSGEIYTISVDGKNLFQVTNVGSAYFPSWSPDDKRIAYDVTSLDSMNGIWIFDLENQYNKYLGMGRDPDWSPNGKRFVYMGPPGSTKSENQIWISDTNGSNRSQLTQNTSITNRYPSWSPDGKHISWTSGKNSDEIWIMNSDGTNQFKLTTGEKPSWSPDGKKIVYSKPASDKIALFIIELENGKIKQLTY